MLNSEQMDFYCQCYDGRKANFNEKTWELIDELFELINKIKPCGKDNLHTLWFSLKYSPVQYDEEEVYIDEYAEENIWYKLTTSSYETEDRVVKFIAINNKVIMQYILDHATFEFEEDISDLISCLIEEVNKIIIMMEKDEYNDYICKNLSYSKRYGTITRKDYYKIYEEERKEYLKNISKSEVKEFERLIGEKLDKEDIENKLTSITARDFYNACYLGYTENKYANVEKYSPKEAYYRYADGRDEDGKWYYFLRGKSFGRSIEAIKFYLALRRKGLPVFLENAQEMLARVLEIDKIGIVPDFIIPRYCESSFPQEKILDFIHLPYDENKEKMIKYATWQPIEKQYLKQVL